ncbi:MAG TPA: hypothetical protein VJ731_17205 [Terriglobales bacterium]|nr:hypothetical protein [Terriglobales bacterium]
MDVNGFLAGLPALLGIVGFIAYQILQHFGKPNTIVAAIVEKLRQAAPERVPDHRLTAAAVDRLLRRDDGLRRLISEQDFALLKKVLNQQFATALVVYLLCGGLCVFGVVEYVKQQNATKITGISVVGPDGENNLVDLDPLTVNWRSEGPSQQLRVYLENSTNQGRSKTYTVESTDRGVTFCPDDYRTIRPNRQKGGHNSFRAVLETADHVFTSEKFDLSVGFQLLLVADRRKATLAAMIDNSLVQDYPYEAKVVLPQKNNVTPVVFGGNIISKKDWPLRAPDSIEWQSAKIVLLSPAQDRAFVRPSFLVDQNLGVPPSLEVPKCGP